MQGTASEIGLFRIWPHNTGACARAVRTKKKDWSMFEKKLISGMNGFNRFIHVLLALVASVESDVASCHPPRT